MKILKIHRSAFLNDPLRKVAVYLGLVWFTLWQPVIVIFWLKNGLTMGNVMLLKSLHGIAVLLFEIPTGIITDRFGAKISLITASMVYVISLVVYTVGRSFYAFLCAEIIAALGTALISGSDSAYVYTLLDLKGRSREFSDVLGRIHSARLLSQTIAVIIGGFVAQFLSLRLTLTLTMIPNALSIIVAFSLPNVKTLTEKEKVAKPLNIFVQGAKALFNSAKSASVALNYIVVVSAGLLLFWMYQPLLKLLNVKLVYFGIFMAAFNLTAMFFSFFSGKVDKFLGSEKAILLANIIFVGSAFFVGSDIGKAAILFLFGLQTVRGLQSPLFHKAVLNYTPSESRATTLSILGMLVRLSFIVFAPLVGILTNIKGVTLTIRYIAVLSGLVIASLYFITKFLRFKNVF